MSNLTSHSIIACAIAVTGTAGCGAGVDHVFTPELATVTLDGFPATARPIPQERPQGEVRIASFGVTELTPAEQSSITVLHVRLAITNDGDATPWTVDTREQQLDIPGEGRATPLFANSDVQTLPVTTIGQHERRVIDLYFPVPATVRGDGDLVSFDVLWQVHAERIVAERATFHRVDVDTTPPAPEVYVVAGWGPQWWYDPLWPRPHYHHRPVIIVRPPHHGVIVRPPDRHHRWITRDHRH